MKKLSIIIPVYNAERFLRQCLDSILISKKDFEVILINDGSKDNSGNICEEYANNDKRIRVIHKENNGVSSARNDGINIATGKYLMFVDSDDYLSSYWDNVIDYIENEDIYYFNLQLNEIENKDDLLLFITGCNDKGVYLSGPFSKVFKNDLIRNKVFFNESLINGEDMFFNLESALLANSFKLINFSFYNYRQSIGQATRRFDVKIINSDKSFHKLLNDLFKKYNVNENLSNEIKHFCLVNAIIMILNRISYIGSFKEAKKHFDFLNETPYKAVVCDKNNKSWLFKLARQKHYFSIYYLLRLKNKLHIWINKARKNEFIKI